MSYQTFLPGTEPPAHSPEIESALDAWLAAKAASRAAAEHKRVVHTVLLAHMAERGVEVYPFVCPQTGKRKVVTASVETKAKVTAAPRERREDEDHDAPERPSRAEDAKVELRMVPRASVEAEIDPFGGVRATMADTEH